MFFQCPKCKNFWQYPIEKCPQCFFPLERVVSKKIKVIGVSKVEISSFFHQKVPYFVLLLEDEKGNKWVQKSVKEYMIGDDFIFSQASEKKEVAIWRIKYDILEGIEKVVELLGGLEINENSKILILPRVEKVSHSYLRDNTSPEFLESIFKFFLGKKIKKENFKVCSQSFDEIPVGLKAAKAGLLDVCQKYKILPFDLAQGNFVKKGDLEISEEVFKADLILNLPILKMGKTVACENLFFFLKKENFLSQKYLFSEKEIFEKLKKELPEILTIADANHIQDEKGINQYLNLIFASFDPLNLERIFFEITKKNLSDLLSDVKIEKIKVLGRKVEEIMMEYC